jgi:hypothetical protein
VHVHDATGEVGHQAVVDPELALQGADDPAVGDRQHRTTRVLTVDVGQRFAHAAQDGVVELEAGRPAAVGQVPGPPGLDVGPQQAGPLAGVPLPQAWIAAHGSDPTLFDPVGPSFAVEVTRSKRRRKSVAGQLVGSTLKITIPAWMSKADEARAVEDMVRRFARRQSTERFDLPRRAARLAARHGLPRPRSVTWADAMQTRWGSCTPATGSVRLSTRLAAFPDWVVDYVLVHELAHLAVADHSAAFWQLVERYPLAERARGYLIAKSNDAEPDDAL